MTAPKEWTPLGCGVRAVNTADDNSPGNELPEFPGDLAARLLHLNLELEDIYLAWEISLLAVDIDSCERRSLILAILALRLLAAEGSTRLPFFKKDVEGRLSRILKDFGAAADERAAVMRLLRKAQDLVSGSEKDSEPEAAKGLPAVFGGPQSYRPLIIDHGCLYMQKMHSLEARVGKALRNMIGNAAGSKTEKLHDKTDMEIIEKALNEVFSLPPEGPAGKIELDQEQKEAVRTALRGRITIVSGRPGSGKTSIVASLLRVLARTGNPPLELIALTAPTGKAAERMRLAISSHLSGVKGRGEAETRLLQNCPPATTLHRLLGYSPGRDRFLHNEHNPLSQELVIVDESSMIDLALMDRLLQALRPEARVVFLGDADQLPSIEAGAVLRDICQSKAAIRQGRVVNLLKSYRARADDPFGKAILDLANYINTGRNTFKIRKDTSPSQLHFKGVELIDGEKNRRQDFFEHWLRHLRESLPDLEERLARIYEAGPFGFDEKTTAELQLLIKHLESYRILCATRIAAAGTGSAAVNEWIHQRWLEERRKVEEVHNNSHYIVGEPVLVTRNDYNLHLYNGDSGVMLHVAVSNRFPQKTDELMAVFPRGGGFVAYPPEVLRGRMETAWASTVHKAQGSEYDHVAIILPEVPVRTLNRELLYTAVTRAKRSVVIVGSEEILLTGIKQSIERTSGLADMLL